MPFSNYQIILTSRVLAKSQWMNNESCRVASAGKSPDYVQMLDMIMMMMIFSLIVTSRHGPAPVCHAS